VVTDLALMRFDPQTRRMRLDALQDGVTVEAVQQQTGFELAIVPELTSLAGPTSEELGILRVLDPDRVYLG
jgi:acyl CoA:acetate/3-ketoacid CoA transferase beta subunit